MLNPRQILAFAPGCPLWVKADVSACIGHVRYGPNSFLDKGVAPVMARIIKFLSSNDKTRLAPVKFRCQQLQNVERLVLRSALDSLRVKALAIACIRLKAPIIVIIGSFF
jgi:hypothetical protein